MLGLRFTFNQPHQRTWPTDGTIDWLWPAAERADTRGAGRGEFPPGRRAGRRTPSGATVDHRSPGRAGARRCRGLRKSVGALALAKYPNVAIKATGAPSYSSESYPFRNIQPYLRQIYDAFGPERMFWGTDITRMPCSWKQCVTFFTEELSWLSESDKELIMGRALCNWLNWQLPG